MARTDERVLVLAPVGRDARLIEQTLTRADLVVQCCQDIAELRSQLAIGAGLLLLTDEVLNAGTIDTLTEMIGAQPAWSDLPLVVLLRSGRTGSTRQLYDLFGRRSLVVLLERPIGSPVLISVLRSLLQARFRQYQVRDLLEALASRNDLLSKEVAERKAAEMALQEAQAMLEARVQERTLELSELTVKLQAEIREREETAAILSEARRKLAEARDAERAHLARELHDGPMQELNAVIFQLMLPGAGTQEGPPELASIGQKLAAVNQRLRSLSYDLRPPLLVEFGLPAAMRAYAERVRAEHKMPVLHLTLPDESQPIEAQGAGDTILHPVLSDEAVTLALYRIYQQAVRNAVQHAEATQIWVRLAFEAEHTVLEIQDDGKGFAMPRRIVDLAHDNHLGIIGMMERAENAGGVLRLKSTPGGGTTVRVLIPHRQMNDPGSTVS